MQIIKLIIIVSIISIFLSLAAKEVPGVSEVKEVMLPKQEI